MGYLFFCCSNWSLLILFNSVLSVLMPFFSLITRVSSFCLPLARGLTVSLSFQKSTQIHYFFKNNGCVYMCVHFQVILVYVQIHIYICPCVQKPWTSSSGKWSVYFETGSLIGLKFTKYLLRKGRPPMGTSKAWHIKLP